MMNLYKLNKTIFLILFFILQIVTGNVFGQASNNFENLVQKYPDEREVIINSKATYQILFKQQKLKILKDTYSEYIIMNDLGVSNFSEKFFTSDLSPVRDFSAYTIRPNGSKIKTNLAVTKNSTTESIFYDDVRVTEVTYKDLEPGAKKVLKTTTEFLDPALLHKFIFGGEYPAEKMTFTVEVDKMVEIGYKIFNADIANIKLKKTSKGGKTIYTWTASNLKSYEYESNQPSYLNYLPHIVIYIKSYPKGDSEVELFDDVSKLFKHYGKYVSELNKEIDEPLRIIADEITKGITDEEEQVKQIYYWVKDNIKYIAYENGYEGFIPREANLVCERKFGDCKDMASIITAMCQYKGIDNVKLAWIGSRKLPYSYEELPTPQVDNHMIAVYLKNDKTIFLDATDSYTTYGLPTGFIQGKEALIRLNKEEFIISKVPIISPEINTTELKIYSSIDDQSVVGEGVLNFEGLAKTNVIQILNHITTDERLEYFENDLIHLGNNKFSIQSYQDTDIDNRDSLYSIDFKYKLENYIVELESEIYINMFYKELAALELIKKERKYPIEFDILEQTEIEVNLDLENKYTIDNLPDPLNIENELLAFHAVYEMKGQNLKLSYSLTIKTILIDNPSFEEWNKSIELIKNYIKETITLRSKK